MRPQQVTVTGVAISAPQVVDRKQNPVNIGFAVTISATATFTVEHTFSDILNGETAVWFPHATVVAATANANSNYAFPITAIRLNVAASTGTATLTILQGSSQ